jgi:hypothetical protein
MLSKALSHRLYRNWACPKQALVLAKPSAAGFYPTQHALPLEQRLEVIVDSLRV